ncbi:MAG: PEP-CTERM sorting domain-containing protein [Gammaproteobacteria bacterium]|nr:PEP-CTERM sorting domain-containing protein [Gammaproteobacteria bacterium]
MKKNKSNLKVGLISIFCVCVSFSTHAAYISDGQVITNDTTGLEWLSLSSTRGMTYANALSSNAANGWRYASNNEVVSLFNDFFSGYVTNTTQGSSVYSNSHSSSSYPCGLGGTCYSSRTSSTPDSAYTQSQQYSDISNWFSFFGTTYYNSWSSGFSQGAIGLYRDEMGALRELGAGKSSSSSYSSSYSNNYVNGPDFAFIHSENDYSIYGTFLVRSNIVTTVPEPGVCALMLFGLVGFGIARRRIK